MRKTSMLLLSFIIASSLTAGCAQQGGDPPAKEKPLTVQQKGAPLRALDASEVSATNLSTIATRLQDLMSKSWPHLDQRFPEGSLVPYHLFLSDGGHVLDVSTASVSNVNLVQLEDVVKMPSKEHAGELYKLQLLGNDGLLLRLADSTVSSLAQVNITDDQLFDLFHDVSEKMFQVYKLEPSVTNGTKLAAQQSIPYPVIAKPRLYRTMLLQHLEQAYLNANEVQSQQDHLGKARYWLDVYQQYAADDAAATRYGDVVEGSAAYMADIATAYAAIGHTATAVDLKNYSKKRLSAVKLARADANAAESKRIARLAGHLADEQSINWQAGIASGTSSVQALLKDVSYVWEATPDAVEKQVETFVTERNKHLGSTVLPFVHDMANKNQPLLVLPFDALQRLAEVNGYYRAENYFGQVWNQFSGRFKLPSGYAGFRAVTMGVTDNTYKNVDALRGQSKVAIVPLDAADFELKDKLIVLKGLAMEGMFNIIEAKDQFGRKLYVADNKAATPAPPTAPGQPAQPSITMKLRDIKGHWAEEEIQAMYGKGVLHGYKDGTFRPNGRITRAEFTKAIVDGFALAPMPGTVFADTQGHWAKDAIATASAHGVIDGIGGNKFAPDDPISRQEIALILVNAGKFSKMSISQSERRFHDIGNIAFWAREEVLTLVARGIMSGDPRGYLHPRASASRAEACSLLFKILQDEKKL